MEALSSEAWWVRVTPLVRSSGIAGVILSQAQLLEALTGQEESEAQRLHV